MISEVGNKNDDERGFELECILCGRAEGISLIAHRNKTNIVGFIAACRDCKSKVFSAGFTLLLRKEEDNG